MQHKEIGLPNKKVPKVGDASAKVSINADVTECLVAILTRRFRESVAFR